MDCFTCPTDIICGVLSCIGIYCCCYWGVAMRYESPALQQTQYIYYTSKTKTKSKSKTKIKSKSKIKSESEHKQYNSDSVITEENQLELSHFYGDEPDVVTKLPDEYKAEPDEGIFTSARFLRMFSKSVLHTSPHNTERNNSPSVISQRQELAANTQLNESQKSFEVHSPTTNVRNVKNMIKLPPIMIQQLTLKGAKHTEELGGDLRQETHSGSQQVKFGGFSGESFAFGGKPPNVGGRSPKDGRRPSRVDSPTANLPETFGLQTMFAEDTDGSHDFIGEIAANINNTGKISESLELDDMVPVHYRIQKKSPKNIVGNGEIANLTHSDKRAFAQPSLLTTNLAGDRRSPDKFEQNHVQHFVHKKKSIFFSNEAKRNFRPTFLSEVEESRESIAGIMLGARNTSQNEIIFKSYKTPRTPPRTPPHTPRLEAQKSLHDIRMNNASNFILSL